MIKEFHSWNVLLDPVLPAREVVVAYLNECGFSMFEPHEKGVLVHGDVEEVDEHEAEMQLEAVSAFATVRVEKRRVAQENWNAKWESEYPQVVVVDEAGEVACTIRAPFHDAPTEGVDVIVAPQMSFGTGHHATTHLMTARLLSLGLEGKRVLDMGCGTGVLALVAAKAGAAPILGVDIEHDAVQNAQDNHALNVDLDASDMSFVQGDGAACDDMPDGSWDVVCANIHKNVLALEASVHASGLEVHGVDVRDGWACMHCGKPLA